MQPKPISHLIRYLRWILWALLLQLVLANISAAFYAYKFTHFYEAQDGPPASRNLLTRTWKLFSGPSFEKTSEEATPAFPHQEVWLPLENKLRAHAWYSPGDTARPCVILLHGYMANKGYLLQEAAMYRQWGHPILLVDFRAHGRSDGHNATFGHDETEELVQAVAHIRSRGHQDFVVHGISIGSVVALKAVAEGKVRPQAVIADMPFGSLRQHYRNRAQVLGFPAEPFATLVTFWTGLERGYNGFQHRVDRYAKGVRCPVLLQWGAQDPFVQQHETEAVFAGLAGPKKLVVYPHVGHESFLMHDPVRWQQEVGNFLSKWSGAR